MFLRELIKEDVKPNAYEQLKAEFPNLNTILRYVPGVGQAMAVADAASAIDMYQKTMADIEAKYPNIVNTLKPDPHLDIGPDDIASFEKDMTPVEENFADGRNPQDKGDSARHGIPKHASLSSLDKIAHQGGRKGQLAHWQANMRRGRMKEDAEPQERNLMTALEKFLPIVMQELKISKLPKIKLEKKITDSEQPTFGVFKEHEDVIHLGIDGRHILDILRTLAHELVHFKQGTEHELDSPDSGATGSPQENQAHAVAGIIMRHFNKNHPEYFDVDPINLEVDTNVQEDATVGGTIAANVSVGAIYKNKPGKSMKNKDGTVKNALDMPNSLLTGGSLKR
jgi:Zn-dependent peptidase ImmA (M78 family)